MEINDCSTKNMVIAVIVTYNASPWIEKCLSSLIDSSFPIEIIVVDNNSTDNTHDKVQKFPSVLYLQQSRNLGFAAANNIGIRQAIALGADFLFLLNQDAHIEKSTIAVLLEAAQNNPDYGIISPVHLNKDGSEIDARFLHHINTNGGSSFFTHLYINNTTANIYALEFLNAAAWFIRKELFLTIGGFDPLYFMYAEDDDLCLRARKHGFKIGLVPTAKIHHYRESPNTTNTPLQSLYVKTQITMSGMTLRLKAGSFSFLRRFGSLSIDTFFLFLRLILSGHVRIGVITLLAYFMTLCRIRKIWIHIQLGGTKGAHWLSL